MTWHFFIDESGHDHKAMPYEVRGGIALHVKHLWPFVQDAQRLELDCFGCRLNDFGKEIKGSTLIDRKRYKFAGQKENLQDEYRRMLCRSFLEKGRRHNRPNRDEFTAYGQACIRMAQKLFDLLRTHEAVLFASAIPRGIVKPPSYKLDDYLRKDVIFFLERFFYFLERQREHGILVMDETEKHEDRRLVVKMERYFTKTDIGRHRTAWIVPTPFFVGLPQNLWVEAKE